MPRARRSLFETAKALAGGLNSSARTAPPRRWSPLSTGTTRIISIFWRIATSTTDRRAAGNGPPQLPGDQCPPDIKLPA